MLDDGHQAESDDGDINLRLHRVLRSAPELLDLEMLPQPLEEQLNLPAVFVEFGDQQGSKTDGVGQVASRDMLPHSEEVTLAMMGFKSDYQVP